MSVRFIFLIGGGKGESLLRRTVDVVVVVVVVVWLEETYGMRWLILRTSTHISPYPCHNWCLLVLLFVCVFRVIVAVQIIENYKSIKRYEMLLRAYVCLCVIVVVVWLLLKGM